MERTAFQMCIRDSLLAGEENAHSEAFDEPDGPRLAVSVDAPCEEWVRGAFELAKACFALLAERYPENVRFADVSLSLIHI